MVKRVLVVDDSKFIRDQIKKTLGTGNYDILEAANGRQAMKVLSEQDVDFMITDLVMPGMDGIALLKEMAKLSSRPPVIVLTADVQQSVKEECLKLGVVHMLNKPFEPDQLLDVVKEVA